MKIAFVIARVGEEKNIIQKMSLTLAEQLRQLGSEVTVYPFNRKTVFKPWSYRQLRKHDAILISNVGLQYAYYSIFKHLHLLKKPIIGISYGSDIRQTNNRWINLFNKLSRGVTDLLIVINPDLLDIAIKRGYKHVKYVHSWAGEIT